MCRFLLALIIGLPLRGGHSSVRLIRAVRALLDFLYLAQYPAHMTETLHLLKDALHRFHANKSIFIDLGIRSHFQIPKLHALEHYVASIRLFGTTDNYDTQYTERLHIDFSKDAYRATNHKDEFPQMTQWLERKEKVEQHQLFIQWQLRPHVLTNMQIPTPLHITGKAHIQMTHNPTIKALSFERANHDYGATYLRDALARFIVKYRNPSLMAADVERLSTNIFFGFRTLPVFHKIKLWLDDVQGFAVTGQAMDVVHTRPFHKNKQGRDVPARFDTVLINEGAGGTVGLQGYRVGQVRLIFHLPLKSFTAPDPNHGLYKIRRCIRDGARLASIIEVRNIRRSCHLYPEFGPVTPREWTSSNVLDKSPSFWINSFADRHTYMTVF
ncbi:hypothetical protein AcV7_007219 [Taiwanofungus camphoratus]|nr:hypothetical protein AcV7_007219 [Antrodia cinnamomea]